MLSKLTSLKVQQKVCCCLDVLSGLVVKLGFGPEEGVDFLCCCFAAAPEVPKSVPVFCPHRGLFVHSERVFEVSRLVRGTNTPQQLSCPCSVCVCAHIILPHLASKTRIKTHKHEASDNLPESVCKAGV